jgi:hypothetical protein
MPVVIASLAVGIGEEGLQTRHQRVVQPKKIRHVTAQVLNRVFARKRKAISPDPVFLRLSNFLGRLK